MKEEYDFERGKRGAVIRSPAGKTRITIRIDDDVLEWFREAVHEAGGGSYQTLMNQALRSHIEDQREILEDTLRRVIREEMPRTSAVARKAASTKQPASSKSRRQRSKKNARKKAVVKRRKRA